MLIFAWILLIYFVVLAFLQVIDNELNITTWAVLIFFILYIFGNGRL